MRFDYKVVLQILQPQDYIIGEANLVTTNFPNCHKLREISMAMIGNRTGDIGKKLQHSREEPVLSENCIETLLVKEM